MLPRKELHSKVRVDASLRYPYGKDSASRSFFAYWLLVGNKGTYYMGIIKGIIFPSSLRLRSSKFGSTKILCWLVSPRAPSYLNSGLLGYVNIGYIEPRTPYLGNCSPRVMLEKGAQEGSLRWPP